MEIVYNGKIIEINKKKYFKMGAKTQLSVLMVINSKLCIRYKV